MITLAAALLAMQTPEEAAPPTPPLLATGAVLEQANADPRNWRALDAQNTLYMDVNGGRLIIELNPTLAPKAVANVKALVGAGHFNGGTINRVQDNYAVQWSGPDGAPRGQAAASVAGEPDQPLDTVEASMTPITYGDTYAPQTGFLNGFPVARDGERIWQTYCYGAVGVGREDDLDGADGSELYIIIGHAPRHLDRNITLIGRVIDGMPYVTSLPRGTGELGFYETDAEKAPIERIALPPSGKTGLEIMRTDSEVFRQWVDVRANRKRDGWFTFSHGAVDVCNIPVPMRETSAD